jgi:hypothetical protein
VRRDVLLADIGIAVLAAVLVLVITPGVAVAGMIAILVLVACAVSLVVDSRRGRKAPPVRARRPPRRPPSRPSGGRPSRTPRTPR